jgi:hypothetical protein
MAERADREKFGGPLQNGDDKGLECGHGAWNPAGAAGLARRIAGRKRA